jgi:ribosomal protein S18 acetylase RimI-like enzyme
MTHHPLDNAVWLSLTGPQREFARLGARAGRYHPQISPIAAVSDESDASFDELARVVKPGEFIAIACERALRERHWQPLMTVELGQWIHEQPLHDTGSNGLLTLGAPDQHDMLALARLADPGPFELETWRLGTYFGVRADGQLVAMAGERMRLPGFIEVSAVATRPGFEGRGYASRLVRALLGRQHAAGDVPFLHVRVGSPSERAATRVYEKLGFTLRRMLPFRAAMRRATTD